ncbi:hypothetical protein BC834DRAFT_841464 [Gloeopeniophorella convolvens]|nr:hypothetical protein BC834DRAFT_841464 [Gloeopeniophorella convolvens]
MGPADDALAIDADDLRRADTCKPNSAIFVCNAAGLALKSTLTARGAARIAEYTHCWLVLESKICGKTKDSVLSRAHSDTVRVGIRRSAIHSHSSARTRARGHVRGNAERPDPRSKQRKDLQALQALLSENGVVVNGTMLGSVDDPRELREAEWQAECRLHRFASGGTR